jgi:hypothetical protein
MIPKISLQDIMAGLAAAALLPLVALDYLGPLRPRGRSLAGIAFGILLLVLLCSCAPGSTEPLTPYEQDKLECRGRARACDGADCAAIVYKGCMADRGWSRKGGKMVKRKGCDDVR